MFHISGRSPQPQPAPRTRASTQILECRPPPAGTSSPRSDTGRASTADLGPSTTARGGHHTKIGHPAGQHRRSWTIAHRPRWPPHQDRTPGRPAPQILDRQPPPAVPTPPRSDTRQANTADLGPSTTARGAHPTKIGHPPGQHPRSWTVNHRPRCPPHQDRTPGGPTPQILDRQPPPAVTTPPRSDTRQTNTPDLGPSTTARGDHPTKIRHPAGQHRRSWTIAHRPRWPPHQDRTPGGPAPRSWTVNHRPRCPPHQDRTPSGPTPQILDRQPPPAVPTTPRSDTGHASAKPAAIAQPAPPAYGLISAGPLRWNISGAITPSMFHLSRAP